MKATSRVDKGALELVVRPEEFFLESHLAYQIDGPVFLRQKTVRATLYGEAVYCLGEELTSGTGSFSKIVKSIPRSFSTTPHAHAEHHFLRWLRASRFFLQGPKQYLLQCFDELGIGIERRYPVMGKAPDAGILLVYDVDVVECLQVVSRKTNRHLHELRDPFSCHFVDYLFTHGFDPGLAHIPRHALPSQP